MSPSKDLPRYDPAQSYRWNYEHAPQTLPTVDVPAVASSWTFCGRPVPSPLAIAAGPLLNGRWLLYYAALGFDILTYKTTRSMARECYPLPNLQPVAIERLAQAGLRVPAGQAMQGSWAVSFGMPSMGPDVWRADVEWTRRQLPKEKLLVVSVVATPEADWSLDQLADDFARCARWAVDSGADAVETNFSCPNVATQDGQLYQRPEMAAKVAQRVREVIGSTPYLVKLGFVHDEELAGQLLREVGPHVDALSMTNCISATVTGRDDAPLFDGQQRGIGGEAIRTASIEQVRRFSRFAEQLDRPVRIIGGGGIFEAAHVRDYLEAGAEAVALATAAMLDPLVGCRIRREFISNR
jgi:dihydroorotate dehydrogenase